GPVGGELVVPLAGRKMLICVGVRLGLPGLRKKVESLSPGQAQNRSTATPLTTSKAVPPSLTVVPWATTVSTLFVAKLGLSLVAASGTPLMLFRVGMPAVGDPCSRAKPRLEIWKPVSVLTTSTLTNPSPRLMVSGTATVSNTDVWEVGVNGPAF